MHDFALTFERRTQHVGRYQLMANGEVFVFEGSDMIDSVSDLATAACAALIEGGSASVRFENEPGQHVLSFQSLGDGRTHVQLSWQNNPYPPQNDDPSSTVIHSARLSNAALGPAVLKTLRDVRAACGPNRRTLGHFRFPQDAFSALESAYS